MEGITADALIPEIVPRGFQDLLGAEVSAAIGAARHESCPDDRFTVRVVQVAMPEPKKSSPSHQDSHESGCSLLLPVVCVPASGLMAPLTPSLEVSTELVFCETEELQFGLHQTASLQKSFPVVQASLLRQGQAARQSAATPERRCPPDP